MEKLFGADWKRHAKHPDWPREKYTVVVEEVTRERRGSGTSVSSFHDDHDRKKKSKEKIASAQAKTKGVITFLTMAEK